MDPADGKLETGPAGPGLGLPLHLASLATARHLCSALIKVCKTVAIIEDRKSCYGKEKDILPDRIKIFGSQGESMLPNYLELVYLVTALVPSDTACLANSPGRRRRTAVWISREVIVDLQ